MPLGPDTGAVKVTVTPLTGLPRLSTTQATWGIENGLFGAVCWLDPWVIPIKAADPGDVNSYEPISQALSWGLDNPRWSSARQVAGSPASMAGLPGSKG